MASLEVEELLSLPAHLRPPIQITERHPNGVRFAETIDRIDSAFSATIANIAAIDFGTANCSIAYCTTADKEMALVKLSSQEGQVRVPTILLVNEKGEPIKFGNRAMHYYQRLERDEIMNHHLFERIKLGLGPNEDIGRDTKIPDINGKMFFLRDVIALIIKYLKDELVKCFQMLDIDLRATDFHWVITVPAIWNASGKQMMREAAYKAGLCGTHTIEEIMIATCNSYLQPLEVKHPERLSLALEPEAASFYCCTMNERDIAEFGDQHAGIPHTNKYIVVDIGGGTADISAHGLTQEGNIDVLTSPEGNIFGGNSVNQEFERFLMQLVSDPGFSKYISTSNIIENAENNADLRSIIYDEFEQEKKEFGQTYISKYVEKRPNNLDKSETTFNIQLSESFYEVYKQSLQDGIRQLQLQENDNKITLGRRRMLCIHFSKMEEFFYEPVSKILEVLSNVLKQLDQNVHTIFLVGGFGGCQYMYYRVQKALKLLYGDDRFKIIIPKRSHLAVVQGAFRYLKNPEIISSRVADATYGTETLLAFDDKIHDLEYCHRKTTGERLCKHLFSPLVIEGERVNYSQVKRNVYHLVDPSQDFVTINLLRSDDKKLFYTRSPNGVLKQGMKVLATITLRFPTIAQGDVYLTFDFSHAEIKVHAYNESSNVEYRAVIDCFTQSI